jgi:uncharacterized membrane protein YphA (DoxX/SURF4 family)
METDMTRDSGSPRTPLDVHRRLAIPILAASLALAPAAALAHERWFVPKDEQPPTDWGALFSLPVLLALLSGAGTVVLLAWLQRRLGDPLWPRPPFFQRMEPSAPAILGVQAAIAMIFAASRLQLFVPNIDLPHNALGYFVAGLAVVAAFSFITGVLTRVGALLTAMLFVAAFGFATYPEEVVEQVVFLGIAFYLVAVGRGVVRYGDRREEGRSELTDRMLPYALPVLRVCAGVSVLVLGFTEKLLNVQLGIEFLQEYPRFNVAQDVGIDWFTDRRFVLAIGIVEVTAGFALIAGFLPRLVILALWIPFNLGIAFLPPQELIGHLPILSTMYVLLVRGTEGIPPRETGASAAPAQRPAVEAGRGLVG